MDAAEKHLDADQAIEKAFEYFDRFFKKTPAKAVLLEGLSYHDVGDEWRVVIGFELIGRNKETRDSTLFGQTTTVPIRETRTFVISSMGGSLKSME